MRSTARETVYKYLYAKLFNEETDDKYFKTLLKDKDLTEEDRLFAQELKDTVEAHESEIVSAVRDLAKDYTYERIFSTDKCALYIAVAEIKYFDDIPTVVSIDEALSLVRKYSTEESLNFVNGILASVKKEQEA